MQPHSSLDPQSAGRDTGEVLLPFDFNPRTRVVFGSGTVDRLGELALEWGGRRVFLVTDKGLAAAGHEKHAIEALKTSGLEITVYDDVHPNPTTDDVDRAQAVAREANIDLIVGLGGGSSMDCAKGVNFLLTNGGRMADYRGIGKATKKMLPMIAVPTTAGTGSEAQSYALIADPKTRMKMACGDPKAACRVAILDPNLTLSMPPMVAAATGIDAISHALETYVTKRRNGISQLFSRRAWQLLSSSFQQSQANPGNVEARGSMLLGAHLAGAAIENSMLGAAHALANPLSAHYELTHGFAVGLMLPAVIRYNAKVVGRLYGQFAADVGLCSPNDAQAPQLLADYVESLLETCGVRTKLSDCGFKPSDVPMLSEEAARQWTGNFNPREVDAKGLRELYECAFLKSEPAS